MLTDAQKEYVDKMLPSEMFFLAGLDNQGRLMILTYRIDQAAEAKAALIQAREHGLPSVLYSAMMMKI